MDEEIIDIMEWQTPWVRWILLDAVEPEHYEAKDRPSAWLNSRLSRFFDMVGFLPRPGLMGEVGRGMQWASQLRPLPRNWGGQWPKYVRRP